MVKTRCLQHRHVTFWILTLWIPLLPSICPLFWYSTTYCLSTTQHSTSWHGNDTRLLDVVYPLNASWMALNMTLWMDLMPNKRKQWPHGLHDLCKQGTVCLFDRYNWFPQASTMLCLHGPILSCMKCLPLSTHCATPKHLWDHCLEREVYIHSHTEHDIFSLNGTFPPRNWK